MSDGEEKQTAFVVDNGSFCSVYNGSVRHCIFLFAMTKSAPGNMESSIVSVTTPATSSGKDDAHAIVIHPDKLSTKQRRAEIGKETTRQFGISLIKRVASGLPRACDFCFCCICFYTCISAHFGSVLFHFDL